ncbi:MAG: methyl-accepting chemotaxis protein [bacterium]|nr:MAG: methyl-accepting chemotaxis protein [bacterium]
MKKKRNENKPVLTSPWKIGVLVALLCLVVGFGVGYYFVTMYGVELKWITIGEGLFNVQIDSFMFFREMYPLVTGLVVTALISYFVIASAVRRYRYYLASGQDYRKMISLAESIDDLTNPAQIARLSDFPELQSVLRNYGDQIREISQEIDHKSSESRSVDLEMEIESLLSGDSAEETILEGKWWAPLYRKIENHVTDDRRMIKKLETDNESQRRLFGEAVLTLGKTIEMAGQSGEDLIEIVNAIGELNSLARQVGSRGDAGESSGGGMSDSIVKEMESSLQKLYEGGRVLHEFSEESNGLALNMALSAARGGTGDHDLAQFAEQVRSTAERFNKLSGTVSSIAQELLGNCYGLRERMKGSGGTGGGSMEFERYILEHSRKIEGAVKKLQERLCNLGNDLQDMNRLFRESKDRFAVRGGRGRIPKATAGIASSEEDSSIVNFGANGDVESEERSDLVLDQTKAWDGVAQPDAVTDDYDGFSGISAAKDTTGEVEVTGREEIHLDNVGEMEGDARQSEVAFQEEARQPQAEMNEMPQPAGSKDSNSWMEMPGHRWVKIDIERNAQGKDQRDVDVRVVSDEVPKTGEAAMAQTPVEGVGNVREPVGISEKSAPEREIAADMRDPGPEIISDMSEPMPGEKVEEDPVHDLFELGAVEYVEETQKQ